MTPGEKLGLRRAGAKALWAEETVKDSRVPGARHEPGAPSVRMQMEVGPRGLPSTGDL